MQRSAEIVVVGGSVSGSFLAYLLGRTGKRVVVCEQAGFPRKKACGEGLSSIGHKYLVQAGLWSGALDSAATPFYGYNIISHAFGKLSLGSSKGPNPIGYSISRDFIDDFLLRTASELPDVELISQKVVEIMRDGAGWVVKTKDHYIRSRFVVIASGGNASIPVVCNESQKHPPRKLSKVGDFFKRKVIYKIIKAMSFGSKLFGESVAKRNQRYGQAFWIQGQWIEGSSSLPIFIKSSKEIQFIVTPLGKNRVNVSVFQTRSSQFDNRRSGNALEQEVLTYLSTIGFSPTKVESMLGCNSISSRKIHRGSDGLIYVGDALERFDPVGGLGMSHGLCSAAHAAKVIVESRAFESDLSVKARFERKRAFDAFVFRIITGGCYKLIVEQSSFLGVVSKFAPSVSFKFIEFLKGLVSVPSIGNVTLVKSGHLIDFRTSVFRRINVMQPRYTMFASVFLFITLFLTSGVIHASTPTEDDSSSNDKSTWYLPSGLTDSNTTVEFNVDSTWHMVEGKTAGVEGSAKLADNSDPRTLVVEVKLPVAKFDTDSSKRDREMRDVMAEKEFPFVSFESTSPLAQCVPAIVLRDGSCEDILKGVLQIRDVKKDILIPIVISNIGDSFEVTGAIPVKWAEFGVEDPSIFIARLDSTVNVNFKVVLKAATLVQAS